MYLYAFKEDTSNWVFTDVYFTDTLDEAIAIMEQSKVDIRLWLFDLSAIDDPIVTEEVIPHPDKKRLYKRYMKKYDWAWFTDQAMHNQAIKWFQYHDGDNEYYFWSIFRDIGPASYQLTSITL